MQVKTSRPSLPNISRERVHHALGCVPGPVPPKEAPITDPPAASMAASSSQAAPSSSGQGAKGLPVEQAKLLPGECICSGLDCDRLRCSFAPWVLFSIIHSSLHEPLHLLVSPFPQRYLTASNVPFPLPQAMATHLSWWPGMTILPGCPACTLV